MVFIFFNVALCVLHFYGPLNYFSIVWLVNNAVESIWIGRVWRWKTRGIPRELWTLISGLKYGIWISTSRIQIRNVTTQFIDPFEASVAFWRFRKIAKGNYQLRHVCMSVRPSFHPHGTSLLPTDGFSWNLILKYFSKYFEKFKFH